MNPPSRTLLVTGVSSGIGYSIARHMLQEQWQVVGTVRSEKDADRLLKELGEGFTPLIFDVCAPSEDHIAFAAQLAPLLKGQFLGAIVHNAGIALGGPLAFQPEKDFRRMMETNVMGVFKLTQALLQYLTAGSKMVMISSVSGRIVTPFIGGYAASKFALEAMTDAYRNELGMLCIQVIGIQPGPIKTPIWKKALEGGALYEHTPYKDWMAKQEELVHKAEAGAFPVEKVAQKVVQVLVDPKPASRYLIARNKWVIRQLKWLPDTWKDKLIYLRLRAVRKW